VEWHLHKVFGKLGIGSRKELRSALSDAGAVSLLGQRLTDLLAMPHAKERVLSEPPELRNYAHRGTDHGPSRVRGTPLTRDSHIVRSGPASVPAPIASTSGSQTT
jgi:hypothetical protein